MAAKNVDIKINTTASGTGAKQTAADMFLNSFQIDKNNYSKEKDEAKINTVYKKDFIKSSSSFGDSDLLNARSQIMTK